MMAIRLVELKRVLKTTGSIYLHCDTEASHYLKILMDHLFGMENYRAEITWKRSTGQNCAKRNFGDIVDIILYYSRSSEYYFQPQYTELDPEYVKRQYRFSDERGIYRKDNITAPGKSLTLKFEWRGFTPGTRCWLGTLETLEKLYAENRIGLPIKEDGTFDFTKRPYKKTYLHEVPGKAVSNLWDDIPALSANDAERLGYPTQKPVSLLERILKTSSKEGDVVLDPFCGCGATIVASQKLNRQWVGIDITHLAIAASKSRLQDVQFEIKEP